MPVIVGMDILLCLLRQCSHVRRLLQRPFELAAQILDIILRDEIGHVAVGNRWYAWLCERAGLDPVAHYEVLARRHEAPRLLPPFNLEARRQAGFGEEELQRLERPQQ